MGGGDVYVLKAFMPETTPAGKSFPWGLGKPEWYSGPIETLGSFAAEYARLCQGGRANQTVLNLVDECGLRPVICGAGGKCVDTVDGYACECHVGFTKSRHEDSQVCEG